MKKVLPLILIVLLLLSLCACTKIKEPYTVEYANRTFTVNPLTCTISDDLGFYRYEITGTVSDHSITIIYPDGTVYHYAQSGELRWKEGSSYIEDYTPGSFICGALEKEIPADPYLFDDTILGLVIMLLGALFFFVPKVAWYVGLGGFFRKTEPSKTTLLLSSIYGGFVLIAGILIFI